MANHVVTPWVNWFESMAGQEYLNAYDRALAAYDKGENHSLNEGLEFSCPGCGGPRVRSHCQWCGRGSEGRTGSVSNVLRWTL